MLCQVKEYGQCFFIGNNVGVINFKILDDTGRSPQSNPFSDRSAFRSLGFTAREQGIHRRTTWIGTTDNDVLFLFTQERGNTAKGAPGPDGADKSIDFATRLIPYFRTGGDIVRLAIVHVVPLVRKDNAVLF